MRRPLLIDPASITARTSLNSALRWLMGLKHVICPSLGLSFSLCPAGSMIPDVAAWRLGSPGMKPEQGFQVHLGTQEADTRRGSSGEEDVLGGRSWGPLPGSAFGPGELSATGNSTCSRVRATGPQILARARRRGRGGVLGGRGLWGRGFATASSRRAAAPVTSPPPPRPAGLFSVSKLTIENAAA